MHDFCFTIPYGLLVLGGGIFGYVKRGSTASLAGGVGSGVVLLIAGFLSLKAFEKLVASILTWVMGQRYIQTSKIMPAGIVAVLSGLMTAFYLYKIASGGNHFPAKAE
ncbi:protein FATTY ACID EXPORT 6-like isoform X2 [Tasmannia lanceolata]|uniref:protein FATTY ACID EXPORT 6-like isoform X2 n=1 Tax=Tasmannia lanceolata TaxID=3420 RepID=UPI0040631D02